MLALADTNYFKKQSKKELTPSERLDELPQPASCSMAACKVNSSKYPTTQNDLTVWECDSICYSIHFKHNSSTVNLRT